MKVIRRGGPVVLVVLALLLVFTGSATATRLITGKQIKNGSVTGADVRSSSLTGNDVRDGSLQRQDLHLEVNQVLAPAGEQGAPGEKGPTGARGVRGLRSLSYQRSQPYALGPQITIDEYVPCPPGQVALSGGSSFYGNEYGTAIKQSSPASDRFSWHMKVMNDTATNATVFLWAVCAIE